MKSDKDTIDELTAAFFDAFTNVAGKAPAVEALYEIFLPDAIIVNSAGDEPVLYDVEGFVEPRRELLTGGAFTDFQEREVTERTELFGRIAQRFSAYEKSWKSAGERWEGRGAKTIQFVRTPGGWKISALAWDDEPARLIRPPSPRG